MGWSSWKGRKKRQKKAAEDETQVGKAAHPQIVSVSNSQRRKMQGMQSGESRKGKADWEKILKGGEEWETIGNITPTEEEVQKTLEPKKHQSLFGRLQNSLLRRYYGDASDIGWELNSEKTENTGGIKQQPMKLTDKLPARPTRPAPMPMQETETERTPAPEPASPMQETETERTPAPEPASPVQETETKSAPEPEPASSVQETETKSAPEPEPASSVQEAETKSAPEPEPASSVQETEEESAPEPEPASSVQETEEESAPEPEPASSVQEAETERTPAPEPASPVQETETERTPAPESASSVQEAEAERTPAPEPASSVQETQTESAPEPAAALAAEQAALREAQENAVRANEIMGAIPYTEQQAELIETEERMRFYNAHAKEAKNLESDYRQGRIGGQKRQQPKTSVEAFNLYSGGIYYSIINYMLRNGTNPKTVEDDNRKEYTVLKEDVDIALCAIRKMYESMNMGKNARLEQDRIVYRGAGSGYTNILRSNAGLPKLSGKYEQTMGEAEALNQKLPGTEIQDKAYVSTSFSQKVAWDFAMHNGIPGDRTMMCVLAPKGLKAKYIAPISKNAGEKELLIDQNTPMKIRSAKSTEMQLNGMRVPDGRWIVAEFMPSSGNDAEEKTPDEKVKITKYWDGEQVPSASIEEKAEKLAKNPDSEVQKALTEAAAETGVEGAEGEEASESAAQQAQKQQISASEAEKKPAEEPEEIGAAIGQSFGKPLGNAERAKQIQGMDVFSNIQNDIIEQEEKQRFYRGHEGALRGKNNGQYMDETAQAYQRYSGGIYYTIMNYMLRRGTNPKTVQNDKGDTVVVGKEEVEIALATIRKLSEDMNKKNNARLEQDRVVYRGVGKGYTSILRKSAGLLELPQNKGAESTREEAEELNAVLPGKEVRDAAFVSTSLSMDTANMFARQHGVWGDTTYMRILAPNGLKAQYIAPISDMRSEKELLVNQNTPMKVRSSESYYPQTAPDRPVSRMITAEFMPAPESADREEAPDKRIKIEKYWEKAGTAASATAAKNIDTEAQAAQLAEKLSGQQTQEEAGKEVIKTLQQNGEVTAEGESGKKL